MNLALLGDVMLGRGVAEEIARRPPESFWGNTLPLLRSADLVIANLECAVTTHPVPWTRTPKVFHFRTPPQGVEVLRCAGVRLVSLANNHVLDFEEPGLYDTLAHLDAAGIAHAGAGRNRNEAAQPAVVEAGGVRVGMLAFTDNEPGWAAGPARPGVNYLQIRPDPATFRTVEDGVARAREQGAQVVILSLHWGPNMVQRPPAHFRAFARGVLERGVDLIYGHSAHIFQGVEVHQAKLILYDTGDFLDDYAVDPVLRNDWSFIFCVEADAAGIRGLRMTPVRLRYARVDLAAGLERDAILRRMRELCAELDTPVEVTDSSLHVAVQNNPANDFLLTEEPATIRDDRDEVYDLGFIVEDREEWSPQGVWTEHRDAEEDEARFAATNELLVDPDMPLAQEVSEEEVETEDLDHNHLPEAVDLRGHAPGVTTGFGADVPQDIGASGFSVEENPLIIPAEELEYPISTEPLSDEAIGTRDVDELGTEEELERLADLAARLESERDRRELHGESSVRDHQADRRTGTVPPGKDRDRDPEGVSGGGPGR